MREAVIRKFLWEADFSLSCGRKSVLTGDVNYAMGSVFRAVCAWTQVLYAVNRRYLMNEKGAMKHIGEFDCAPRGMSDIVNEIYRLIGSGQLCEALTMLDSLHDEIEGIAANAL
jgi:hypothetical protein